MAKHRSCAIIFLDMSSSTLQHCSSNSILQLNSVSESAQLRLRVSSILQRVCSILQRVCSTQSAGPFIFAYLLCEESRQRFFHFCILREEFRYFVLCTLLKNVLCICIKSLHHSVASGILYRVVIL